MFCKPRESARTEIEPQRRWALGLRYQAMVSSPGKTERADRRRSYQGLVSATNRDFAWSQLCALRDAYNELAILQYRLDFLCFKLVTQRKAPAIDG